MPNSRAKLSDCTPRSGGPLFVCLWMLCCGTAFGQGPQPQPTTPATAPPVERAADSVVSQDSWLYALDENGKLVQVVAPLKEVMEWLESRIDQAAPDEATHSITSITLTGEADDQWCNLQAKVVIHINEDRRFIKVPLLLGEGNLGEINYVGPGEYSYAGFDQKNGNGYQWWLKGKGDHELHLKLTVPVRKQLQTRRLLLTLPPRVGASTLHLNVATPQAIFKYPERSSLVPNPMGEIPPARSAISLRGLGESFDLSWQPTPEKQTEKTSLQSTTSLDVSFTTDSILLKARQQVTATQGNFQELTIRLPAEFKQQNLKVAGHKLEPITDRPNWWRIMLMQPTSGPIDLEWVLERAVPASGETFRLEGFELEGESLQQSGSVTLSSLAGYRLPELQRQGVFLRPVTTAEAQRGVQRGYEFYRQPFLLELELQKIPPSFVILPQAVVRFSSDSIGLDMNFDVQLYRGTLDSLVIEWPEWQQRGWRIEPTSAPDSLDPQASDRALIESIENLPDDPSRVLIRFREPMSNRFSFALRARRLTPDLAEPLNVRLPRVLGDDSPQTVSVAVMSKLNLDVEVTPSISPRGTPPAPLEQSPTSPDFRELKRYSFLSSLPIELTAKVVVRTQSVTTSSELELFPLESEGLVQVDQLIRYDVRYEPLSTLRFRTSSQTLKSLSLFDERGEKLNIEELPTSLGSLRQFRVDLPQQKLGEFFVRLRSTWEQPKPDAIGPQAVPSGPHLVQSVDADFSKLKLDLRDSLGNYLRVSEQDWKRRATLAEGDIEYEYSGKTMPLQLELQVVESHEAASAWSVQKAFLDSSTDGEGTIRTRGLYQLKGSFPVLDLGLPYGYQLIRVKINGVEQSLPEMANSPSQVGIPIPAAVRRGRVLELEVVILSEQATRLTWSSDMTFHAPRLLNALPGGSTFWMTTLPYRQHLFTLPARFNSQFEWVRDQFVWTRTPLRSSNWLNEWVASNAAEEETPAAINGNLYLFHTFGEPEELTYRTMNRPMVILVGAGLALILSFLLLKLSATKNVLTFLLLALGLSVAGVWYPTSVALLLQPAILGFLLAVLASFFDRLMRGETGPPVITLEEIRKQESDYASSIPTQTREHAGPLNSEEPTEVRPRQVPTHESLSSSFGAAGE